MLKVITVTNNIEATKPLLNSLDRFGWDWVAIQTEWRGFGTKLVETYNYLKQYPEVTEFIFCDAFDVVALGNPKEFNEKINMIPNFGKRGILFSAEKSLWPPIMQPFENLYETHPTGNRFINSGLYFANSKRFMELFESYPPKYETDDQYWANTVFMIREGRLLLDRHQDLFCSYSHMRETDIYTYNNGRLQINGVESVFAHGNGKTDMTKILELI